jgi:hypothetical protein
VNSRCWYAARAGSKLIRSPKKALECSSKQCVGNGAPSIYVFAVLFGGATDPVSDWITQGNWYSPALFSRVAHTHRCQVSPHDHPVPVTFSPCSSLVHLYEYHPGITCRIRLQPHALAFVRVGLLPATGGTAVASSGAFTDARSGAATALVVLRAGHYIIKPEVDGPGGRGTFSLLVYCKSAGISLAPL